MSNIATFSISPKTWTSVKKRCPLIEICNRKIPEDIFKFTCMSTDYVYCEYFKEHATKDMLDKIFKEPKKWLAMRVAEDI